MVSILLSVFLPFIFGVIVLYWVGYTLKQRFVRVLGLKGSILFFWFGTVVHELSHLVGCLLTLTKVERIRLFSPQKQEDGSYQLGVVEHVKSRNPLTNMLIGLAPLVGGAVVMLLALRWLLPTSNDLLSVHTLQPHWYQNIFFGVRESISSLWSVLRQIDLTHWQTYLFIYIIFSVGAHLAPSAPDFKNARTGIITLIILTLIIYIVGLYYGFVGVVTTTMALWLYSYINILVSLIYIAIAFIIFCLIMAEAIYRIRRLFFHSTTPTDPNWF